MHDYIFLDFLGVVPSGFVIAPGEDAGLGHHVLDFQLVKLDVIVLVVEDLGKQLVGVFPLVKGYHPRCCYHDAAHMHAVSPVDGLGQGEQALGHLAVGIPLLAAGVDVKDVAEALLARDVFFQLQQVAAIVGHTAHLHRNAVRQCDQDADDDHVNQQRIKPEGQVKGPNQHQGYQRDEDVGQHAAGIVPARVNLFQWLVGRSHQALASCSRQLKVAPPQVPILVDEGEVEEAERHKAVTREQSRHQVAPLVQDYVQDEDNQDRDDHPGDSGNILQREFAGDFTVHSRDGLPFGQGDDGADNHQADTRSDEQISDEFQQGFHSYALIR